MTVREVFLILIFRRNSCFRAPILNPDQIWWHWRGGGVGGGNPKSRKTLRVERSGWNLVGRIRKCRRYVIDVTRLDPLCLGKLGRGVQCFGELVLLDVLGRGELVGVSGTYTNWLDKVVLPDSTIWGGGWMERKN